MEFQRLKGINKRIKVRKYKFEEFNSKEPAMKYKELKDLLKAEQEKNKVLEAKIKQLYYALKELIAKYDGTV